MKFNKYIGLVIILASFLTACDDFLDKAPLDQITEANYWSSAKDLEIYNNQFYPLLPGHRNGAWDAGVFSQDMNSDNMIPGSPNSTLAGTRTVPASGAGWSWGSIRSVNVFLENYSKAMSKDPWEIVAPFVGEAHFFKALLYFDKVKRFGDVPWFNRSLETDSPELFANRLSRDVVVDSMIVALDKAIDYLPAKGDEKPGRLNKDVALTYKARVCLYEGTWEKYHAGSVFGVTGANGQKYLTLAAEAAKTVIDGANYSLYTTSDTDKSYAELFAQMDYSSNPEVIMWKKFDQDAGLTHNVQRGICSYDNNDNPYNLSKELVDQYLCVDGDPIAVSDLYEGDTTIVQVFQGRDPRLKQMYWLPGQVNVEKDGVELSYFNEPELQNSASGYQLHKGAIPDYYQLFQGHVGVSPSITFRYAEVLLTYAEAKAELGEISQTIIDQTINLLRARAGMPNLVISNITVDPNWDFPALSPVINEIRRERRIELACEGFRFKDLQRWRAHLLIQGKRLKGAKFIWGESFPQTEDLLELGSNLFLDENNYIDLYQNALPSGFGFDEDRDYLSPIPSDEITISNGVLTQNPGWE
ncbi:RagB/SusD family nutrient uptake outer membrane protein [Puteibacter caeruleilacunae]|nr:RagB/SusD family nutrient uptake outer membrane protein [Puteibacter caeruleilacunae]